MTTSRTAVALVAAAAFGFGSLALAAPAQAADTVHLTKTFTTGAGTWAVPAGATNITVALGAASADTIFGVPGLGGTGIYSLPNTTAGATLTYLVGAVGVGSPVRPNDATLLTSRGGGGTAVGTMSSILAIVGGGGGGGGTVLARATGGAGGVAKTAGAAVGHDGILRFPSSRAPGTGGQVSSGGQASTTADYVRSATYAGGNGENGPAVVTTGSITLASGGFAGYIGGGGGSGYTGGGGGTLDFGGTSVGDYGSGGGGSGYLAASGISFVAGSAGTNSGDGSVVFDFDVPILGVSANSTVDGHVGQAYSWSPVTTSNGSLPYTYDVSVGSLPDGLSISPTTGVISGEPTAEGITSFTVRVTDGSTQSVSIGRQIVVGLRSIVSPSQGVIRGPINVTGTGFDAGSYTVNLDSVTNDIGAVEVSGSGVLTFAGTVPVTSTAGVHTVQIVKGGLIIAEKNILLITGLASTPSATTVAYQGQAFSWSPTTTTGGTAPLSYTVTAGTLPSGLTLDATSGIISGTPTTASPLPSAFSVTVTDSSAASQSAVVQQQLTVGMRSLTAPGSAVQGEAITITAEGLDEGDYSVELHSTPALLGMTHVGPSGQLTFTAAVPAGTDPGTHQLLVIKGGLIVSSSSIAVTVAPVAPTEPTEPTEPTVPTVLASTGSDVGPAGLVALLLLAFGAAISMGRRYGRSRAQS